MLPIEVNLNMSKMLTRIVALAALVGLQTAAHAAAGYDFIKLYQGC